MRDNERNRRLFHAGHYNIIAKRISTEIDEWKGVTGEVTPAEQIVYPTVMFAMRNLAEALADRFAIDNDTFDRQIFLERCGVNDDSE